MTQLFLQNRHKLVNSTFGVKLLLWPANMPWGGVGGDEGKGLRKPQLRPSPQEKTSNYT